jgi:HAE1 family hydrophobic/amphiphilic exporter-1
MRLPVSSWAIRNPTTPLVLFTVLVFAGVVAFMRLPINQFPAVAIPVVAVTVVQPGASPSEMEAQITRRIEGAVAGVGNVKRVTSSVADGVSTTTIEFRLTVEVGRATTDVRDAIALIRPLLPRGIEEPVIQRVDTEGGAVLTLSVTSDKLGIDSLSWFVDDTLTRSLQGVKGVAKIERLGGVDREIRVELDPARLSLLGTTANEVNAQLRALNADLPGGTTDAGGQRIGARALGAAKTVEELATRRITLAGGRSVALTDLASVRDGSAQLRQIARLDDQPVVAVSIYRTKGTSEVTLDAGVSRKLALLAKSHPDVRITPVVSFVDFTRESYYATIIAFFEGTLLAVMVVWLFLRDWRATLIAGLAIPLSVVPTFYVMQSLGFSLNVVTLLSLSLVAGVLVDDAIVEIENIVRHIRMGKTPYQAALEAADEIGLAVVATTAVIVVVFVPVSFMEGIVGQYFIQFGLTVAVATLFSLLVARLITPLAAAHFLRPQVAEAAPPRWLTLYRRVLLWSLGHPRSTLAIGAGFLLVSFALVPLVPAGFLPPEDKSISIMQLELPPGARLQDTDRQAREITAMLHRRPEVKSVLVTVGGAAIPTPNVWGGGEVRNAQLLITLVPPGERRLSVKGFEADMRDTLAALPGVRAIFLSESGGREISIALASDDFALLERTARQVEGEMRALPQLSGVVSTLPLPRPELLIRPRFDDAARLGVSVEQIAEISRLALSGDIEANLAKFNDQSRQVPIRVQLSPALRGDPLRLGELRVPTASGSTVPLAAVADLTYGAGPSVITRYDRQRMVAVESNLNGVSLGDALNVVNALPALRDLPAGVNRFETGDVELLGELLDSFSLALAFGLLMVLGVLVLLFGTVFQPLTIMASLPLSVGGALIALLITQKALSMSSLIGILMLMGIVGKNAILLVDFVIEKRREGESLDAALLEAGMERARPIVMTTIAMVAGMLPIAVGFGLDTAFKAPMAVAVIGGLITSTLLSLIFVPVVYVYVDRLESWVGKRLASAQPGLTVTTLTHRP